MDNVKKRKRNIIIVAIVGIILLFVTGLSVELKVHWPGSLAADSYWTNSNSTASPAAQVEIATLNNAFINLAAKMSPAVVNVYTTTKFKNQFRGQNRDRDLDDLFRFFFGNPFTEPFNFPPIEQETQALGSGIILNKEGYIITNTHVVRPGGGKNADEIMIKFLHQDHGRGFPARVVGVDERTDVAVLKLRSPKSDLTPAPLGDSDKAKVGEWVVAIGNPYGHAHTVTQGIVSAKGRNIEDTSAEFIQTSASINPGNSGGPLFNLYGEVIGINAAIDPRAQGIGFAIPINAAKNVIPSLIREGHIVHGWIGAAISSVSPDVADALGIPNLQGATVRDVVKGGPADKAGILRGDIITKVGKEPVTSQEKLVDLISGLKPGTETLFDLVRKGKNKQLAVRIGEEPANYANPELRNR